MSPTTLAVAMIVLVIGFTLWNKVPMNFVLFVVPFVMILLLGFSLSEASELIVTQINSLMKSTGYMLLFGLIYFFMLTETGMFDILIGAIIKVIGNAMNVIVIMIMTVVIGAIGYLTANISTTYLVCFPIMIPLYKKFNIDRRYAFILCQTALSAMCFLPYGIGLILSATFAGVEANELAVASIPWALCYIPVIALEIAYFTFCHLKKVGTLGIPETTEAVADEEHDSEEPREEAKVEESLKRPKLFWFNLIVFVVVVLCLAVFQIPSYLTFIGASVLTSMVNYRKDFGKIWNKAGMTFFNVFIMLIGVCFYLAAFNAELADGTSMVTALSGLLTGLLPDFLTKYMFVFFLLICVPIIYFVPYQIYNAMYPLFISVGATFGFTSIQIIAPFVCNLGFATSTTPLNSSTHVGCSLCDIEVSKYTPFALVIMSIANVLVTLIAALTGVLAL